MLSLAKFSIRRPKLSLAVWLVIAAGLTVAGFTVSNTVSPSITTAPNTQSSKAQALAEKQFGPTQLVPILLEGPPSALNSQGPQLVRALAARPHTRVLSAWDAGAAGGSLRANAGAKMIVVSVDRPEKTVVKYDQPQIERLVATTISSPVKPYISGQASIDRAVKDASLNNLRTTGAIAMGILFVLLLLGLRAPVAALLVTAVGAASMLAGFGETALMGHVMKLDPTGAALGTMVGLALGVAFALMILDRFHREELPDGVHPRDAATAAIADLQTTGRAVLVGGTGIVVALLLAAVVGPYELLVSTGTGMTVCAAFALGGAVVVMPAAFVLLGRRIEAFSFPAPAFLERGWARLVAGGSWVTRHAVYTGFAATAILAALAVPALALDTGPTDIKQLPKDAKARIAFQEISRVMGPGYTTPYNMIVVPRGRPITDRAVLASLVALEKQIARNKTVYSVQGPGEIFYPSAAQLKKFGPAMVESVKISKQSKKDLLRLIDGLGQAGAGSAQLQSGLAQASSGASQLQGGGGQAQSGAGQLHSGAVQLHNGSGQLTAGLNQALSGAQQLKSGSSQALSGAQQLTAGLAQAQAGGGQSISALNAEASLTAKTSSSIAAAQTSANSSASATSSALATANSMTTGKTDPRYGALISDLQQASAAASTASGQVKTAAGDATAASAWAAAVAKQAPALVNGLTQLHTGAAQLQAGIAQLHNGNAQLASGLGQLSGGGSQLTNGLGQLTNGAAQLQNGLALLTGGAGQLAVGLAGGVSPAGQLTAGLGTMQAAVTKSRGKIPSTADLEALMKQSPGMFSSGYFVLSAVEGAKPADRTAASFSINLVQGGTAGQILIVSRYPASDSRSDALRKTLASMGSTYATKYNAEVAVGGPGGSLGDLTSVTKSRIPADLLVVSVALALILGLALRAIVLPVVTILFSLLVTAATFGAMQLLFGGSDPILGGPGWLDPSTIIGVFTASIGIAMMFSTLLLMRTRETYPTEGRDAIPHALRDTAAAATGAGIVMAAAAIPFVLTDFMFVRTFGVGFVISCLLSILLLRPVLLPAAEAVLGRFGWWPSHGIRPPAEQRTRKLPRLHRPRPAHHH